MTYESIPLDQLPPSDRADQSHVIAAMRDGNAERLTLQQIANFIVEIIQEGAPAALDTLAEISTALNNDPDVYTTLVGQISDRLKKSENLADLTDPAAARSAIGLPEITSQEVIEGSGTAPRSWPVAKIREAVNAYSGIHSLTGADMARQIFVDPVDGVSSFFRLNNVRDAQPRSAVVSSISGDTITLTSDSAADFFRLEMAGVSYVRIWNISKSPVEPAWVKAAPANNTLQVHDAAAIAGWSNGESIQIGDEDGFPGVLSGFGGGIAIDISPMMLTLFGVVFPQKAVSMKLTVFGNTGSARLSGSAAGSGGGSYIGISSQSNGGRADGVATVQTNVPSPISDSNLIFISEDGDPGGKIGLSLATCTGIWV